MSPEANAPLSPQEEVALRRVAHGSFGIAPAHRNGLLHLQLIESWRGELRLTALGQKRYRSLPKAALLSHRADMGCAVRTTLEHLMEKMEKTEKTEKAEPAARTRQRAPLLEVTATELWRPEWLHTARIGHAAVRSRLLEHRQGHVATLEASRARIKASRLLLASAASKRPDLLASTYAS
jgi:hypothetical protein